MSDTVAREGALAFPTLVGDVQFLTDQLAEYEGLGADYISLGLARQMLL